MGGVRRFGNIWNFPFLITGPRCKLANWSARAYNYFKPGCPLGLFTLCLLVTVGPCALLTFPLLKTVA